MDLILQLAALPLWLSALILVIIPSLIAACGPLLVRRLFSIKSIAANNEVAGFKFATLGVVYAVLLGLAVISVWEKFAEADTAATQEAAALAAIDRLAGGLATADRDALRGSVLRYAHTVVDDDWPAMAQGGHAATPLAALNDLYASVLAVTPDDARGATILDALLTQLDLVTDARRTRLSLAEGILPEVVWLVLFTGAAMTIGFTLFFGLGNLGAQMLMTGMLAFLVLLSLFVALSIDHPFTGASAVKPEAIERVLRDFVLPKG